MRVRPCRMILAAFFVITPLTCAFAQEDSAVAIKADESAKSELTESLPVAQAVRRAIEALDAVEQGGEAQTLLADAQRYARMVLEQEPEHPRLLYIMGRLKIFAGRTVDGIRDLQAFTDTREGQNDWKAYQILGDAFVSNYASLAQAQYKKAYALNDREPAVLLGLSRAAAKLGRGEQALSYAEAAVRLDGRQTIAYLTYYAQLLQAMRRLPAAVEMSTLSLELAKQAYRNSPAKSSVLRALQSQYQIYMLILRDKINEAPEDCEAYILFAKAGEELGEIEKLIQWHNALDAITQGVERTAPNTPLSLRLERGRLLGLVGRVTEAVEEYESILASMPDHPLARRALKELRREDEQIPEPSTDDHDQ